MHLAPRSSIAILRFDLPVQVRVFATQNREGTWPSQLARRLVGSLLETRRSANRELKQRRRRRQRERQNKKLAGASRFFVHSLPSLHDYDVKMPNFTFSGGREQRLSFSFPELRCSNYNSSPEQIANI